MFPDVLLFSGIQEEEIKSMLSCLGAVQKNYQKNEYVFHAGEPIESLGLVLSGSVHILIEDVWGNRRILQTAGAGEVFGESYACLPHQPVLVSVEAVENAEILFLNVSRVLMICPSSCPFHHRLVRNLLSILARKNVLLANKMDHVTRHTTREKIMAYLSSEAKRQKSRSFNIPYNRQQMADYLAVERSALSAELSKLQKEGLIAFSKNRFTVILTGED